MTSTVESALFDALVSDDSAEPTLPWAGMSILVTGEVPGMSRSEAKAAVEALGGRSVGSVSRSLSLVVVGEGAGISKMSKARTYGLLGLSAAEFAALTSAPASWSRLAPGHPVAALDDALDPPAHVPTPAGDGGQDAAPGAVATAQEPSTPGHQVGKTIIYPPGVRREVRMLCSCGHRWHGSHIHEALTCPRA